MTFDPIREGVACPVRIDPTGRLGPTRGQVRRGEWRRVIHGFYVPAGVDSAVLDQRIVEAAAAIPAGCAVTGWAALAWTGTKWFSGMASDGRTHLPVPISIDDDRRLAPRLGARLVEDWLFDDDIITVDGLPITRAERAVTFEARRARTDIDATRVIDLAASADRVDLGGLRSYTKRLVGRPGVCRLRRAIARADENVWSPMETTMRLVWQASGFGGPLLCNAPIFDAGGNHLLTPDLFDPERAVAGQYDGLVHLEDGVRGRDLDTESLLRDHGIELVTMINSDLGDNQRFLHRLAGAYRRAGGPTGSWTLEQPGWWVDTSTAAKRRALTAEERKRWLRWQAS